MSRRQPPRRTCTACRKTAAKRDLVRIVRGADGSVRVDWSGKAPGRGAYIGPAQECLRLALERGALERSLQVTIDDETRRQLAAALYRKRPSCPLREEDTMTPDA